MCASAHLTKRPVPRTAADPAAMPGAQMVNMGTYTSLPPPAARMPSLGSGTMPLPPPDALSLSQQLAVSAAGSAALNPLSGGAGGGAGAGAAYDARPSPSPSLYDAPFHSPRPGELGSGGGSSAGASATLTPQESPARLGSGQLMRQLSALSAGPPARTGSGPLILNPSGGLGSPSDRLRGGGGEAPGGAGHPNLNLNLKTRQPSGELAGSPGSCRAGTPPPAEAPAEPPQFGEA